MPDPFEDVMARVAQRWPVAVSYTTDDLAQIPPCPICGARARIESGRLVQPCLREKHYPKLVPATPPSTTPVQRAFDDDAPEEWWHR